MYINAQVLNGQFELNLYTSRTFFLPLCQFGQRNNLQNFKFIYSNISISHPPESKQSSIPQGGRLNRPIPVH